MYIHKKSRVIAMTRPFFCVGQRLIASHLPKESKIYYYEKHMKITHNI